MSFKRFNVTKNPNTIVYYDFGTNVKIVFPNEGGVVMTKDSFIKLLTYFKGYDFLLGRKEIGNNYNTKAKENLGYFVEDTEGNLIVIDISPNRAGLFGDVVFKTIDSSTGKVTKKLSLTNPQITKLVHLAELAGIKSDATTYADIVFVDQLPAETSAKRFTIYGFEGKFYTLNAEESELVEITFETKKKLPSSTTTAKEGILYVLKNNQTISDIDPAITFKAGVYTYTAASNDFTLEDLKTKKVDRLPKVEKADAVTLYIMTADEKDEEDKIIHAKGTVWKLDKTEFVEETRKISEVNALPYVELAVDGTNYRVGNEVSKYSATTKSFTKVGTVVMVEELPDVSTIKVDTSLIYVLTKDDGERKKSTRWVFDATKKEFTSYVDPTEDDDEEQDKPAEPVEP